MKHPTESAYDDEMFPLVAKLIEIAKANRIPLLVSAGFVTPDGRPGTCDTLVYPDADAEHAELAGIRNRLSLAKGVIRGHSGFDTAAGLMITRHHPTTEPTP